MRLLITGAGGMLGTDVRRAAGVAGHEVIALARADLDIRDELAVNAAVEASAADVVINCAAYTDVDGAESDSGTAAAINAQAPGSLAAAAAAQNAWILHISSDYVFAGDQDDPYLETDATHPLSVYGATKLEGELAVAGAAPGAHTIIRSSWLFGAAGRCFPDTMLRLAAEREELAVVDDQVGCPTFTGHLAQALVDLAARSDRPVGILHCAAAGQCSWFGFAQAILREAGVDTPIRPVSTAEFPRRAHRPAYSVLRSSRPEAPVLSNWRHGVADYLHTRWVAA
ncbi:MAG TPA: dTDP-4-dehydrorhamnose reductase [Solirubrobacteraceae bacterium]|jgi:dTDP-4-dehydrorhamnose reductase|nr:dTDP-4-dehydrorhamnose reductase [Solirubrobacteraceae bacterium]